MRLITVFTLLAALALAIFLLVDADGFARWAADQQRNLQNQMATAVRALQSGQPGALFTLFFAAASYGFVHAIGPGHGKALIGSVGLGSSVSAMRLLGIALVSSIAQALWAILLVFGGFFLLEASARRISTLAEEVLAPASYLAIAAIGVILVWRGVRALVRDRTSRPATAGSCTHSDSCNHAHGPSPDQVANLTSLRDMVALVVSIAIRPCTGAIFLLVISWQMDLRAAGAAAVVVMGIGTATFTSLVAVSSVAARTITFASAGGLGVASHILPGLQIIAGAFIVWASLTLLGYAI